MLHLPSEAGEWHLQELVWQWEAQASQHAIESCPHLLCLCLARYSHSEGEARKNCSVVRCGHEAIAFAKFTSPHEISVDQVMYRVQSVVVHLGESPKQGHYRSFLSHGGHWFYTDDGRVAELAQPTDLEVLSRQSYLLWLSRA